MRIHTVFLPQGLCLRRSSTEYYPVLWQFFTCDHHREGDIQERHTRKVRWDSTSHTASPVECGGTFGGHRAGLPGPVGYHVDHDAT